MAAMAVAMAVVVVVGIFVDSYLSEFMRRCVGDPWQKIGVKKRYFCPASISSFCFTRRPVTSGLVERWGGEVMRW